METILDAPRGRNTSQFKSYYVVWKRLISGVNAAFSGLNRTMQYGNYLFYLFRADEILFKSYYVVWKLKKINKK